MRVTTDYYAVLGVRPNANADEIKTAYRRLARVLHPDVNPDPLAQEEFKEITQAYQVLSDPGKRQIHDLGGDPFPPPGGYFRQAPTQRTEEASYPRDRWESYRERRPPHISAGAWNRSRDQAPYSDYLGERPPFSYDWLRPPAPAAKPYRPHPIPLTVVLICAVFAFGVLVASRVFTHHGLREATTEHISGINATWAPSRGAVPGMTPQKAWLSSGLDEQGHPTVQLGLFTQLCGRSYGAPGCDEPVLAYRYYWTECVPYPKRPAGKCWNWAFVNADTGALITSRAYTDP